MKKGKLLLHAVIIGALSMSMMSCSATSKVEGQSLAETFADEKEVALVNAALAGNVDKIKLLVKNGTSVNAVGNNGVTPLLWAMYFRNDQGVALLLDLGADPNLVTEKVVFSPMYFASMAETPELLRLLLKFGGNPNHPERGRIDDLPLSRAASNGRIENIKMLLAAGADINAHDQYNASAARWSVSQAHFEVTAFLLEYGFTYNLPYLARVVNICQVPEDSDAQRWKDKVIVMLKERGVE